MAERPRTEPHRRRWRDYTSPSGGRPIKAFINALTLVERAEVAAAMKEVKDLGLTAAKHVAGPIYEVIADTKDKWFRVLFATEAGRSQVLLALEAFEKKTNKTPPAAIDLARRRLADWRARGTALRAMKPRSPKRTGGPGSKKK
jgi:phage-related protein